MALLMNTGSNSLEQDICPLSSGCLMIFLKSLRFIKKKKEPREYPVFTIR